MDSSEKKPLQPSTGIFKDTARKLYDEYLEQSMTHGMRMIKRTEGDSYGRYIWLGFMAFILILTHLDIYHLAIQFLHSPTETRLSPKLTHVQSVPFPALGVCSNNQISSKALRAFSAKLFTFQQAHRPYLAANSTPELAKQLHAFAEFLLYPFAKTTAYSDQLQNLHDLLVLKYGNGTYPARTILRELSPNCDDIVVRCIMRDKPIECNRTFFLRLTTSGYCCIYNYRRANATADGNELYQGEKNRSVRSDPVSTAGSRHSLQVVLQDNVTDYSLKEYPLDGFWIIVFNPDDYPDTDTGSVTKSLVSYDEEIEVSISPIILEGSDRMKQFSPKMRHCYFLEEGREVLNQQYYSFSECMLHCRTQSVANHCGCMVPTLPGYMTEVPYCTLLDLPCISLWKAVWWQWNTFDYVAESKQSKSTLELCKECLPRCNILSYKIFVNSRPLSVPENRSNYTVGILNGLTSRNPTAVIKFFYKSAFIQVKNQDISGDWIVLLARYGGICSIMYGFSIVGIFEIMYFVTGKWGKFWWRALVEVCKRFIRRRVNPTQKGEEETHQELYWNELRPKCAFKKDNFKEKLGHF